MKSSRAAHGDGPYEALAQSAPDAILTIDENSTILSANPATERIFGYTPAELIGRALTILMPHRLRAAHDSGIERYMSTGRPNIPWTGVQLPALTKDGREIPVEISFGEFRDREGRRVFSGFVRDISDRVRQQQELADRESELKRLNTELHERAEDELALRTLAQSIASATRITDIMQEVAQGALRITRASGAYVEQVVTPEVRVAIVASAGAGTPAVGQEVPYPGSLTEEIMNRREPVFLPRLEGLGKAMAPYLDQHCGGCSILVVPLMSDTGALGALGLLRPPDEPAFDHALIARVRTLGDLASLSLQRLAALRENERRREEAEAAVRSRDEVLSIVSHDLRNPVSTIAMSAALLRDPDMQLDDDERTVQLDIIARTARRMNRLIQDLLDVARIEGGRFTVSCHCETPASLVTDVCDAFRQIVDDGSLELTCQVESELPDVNVDRDRLIQALSNFVSNAIKFTPRGGRIIIGARRAAAGGFEFFVSDTGSGITEEERAHVFDRFWQAGRTAHLGAGLGLAIARGIAMAHGGQVRVDSAPGRGSTFYVTLPASAGCAPRQ